MTTRFLRDGLLGLGLSLALVACGDDTGGAGGSGGSSSSGEGGATSSTAGDGGSTSTGDGGSTGAGDGGGGGGGGEPVDPSTLADWGLVSLYQFDEDDHEVFAAFQRGRPADATYEGGCDVVERDDCTARRCEGAMTPSDLGGMDAGAFTLSGLLTDVVPVRGEDGNYVARGSGPLFAPGAQVEVQLSGGEVPAFDATIDMPPEVLELQPPPGAVTRGEDLHFTWQAEGTPGGFVQVWYLALGEDVIEDLYCIFPMEDAAGTVPGDLMPSGDGGIVTISAAQRREIAVGSHAVTLQGLDIVVSSNFSYDAGP